MLEKICRVIINGIRFIGFSSYRNLFAVSISTHIKTASNAQVYIGKRFRTRNNVELNVREDARLEIGDNVFINSGCIITARDSITIGDNTILGPYVMIYDNDHTVVDGKVSDNHYVTSEVKIGANVWIGAGTVILKGTVIEDDCVIAAGSVVKGIVKKGSMIVQKRNTQVITLRKTEAQREN